MNRRDFLTQIIFSEGRRLLPHQVEQAIFAVECKHSLNASETGSGKFLVALATRRLIEHETGRAVACLFTSPKSALGQFEKEFADNGYKPFALRRGSDAIPADVDTTLVANSTMLVTHREQLRRWRPQLVVLDEAHAFKTADRGAHQGGLRRQPRRGRRDHRRRAVRPGDERHVGAGAQRRTISALARAGADRAPRRARPDHAPACVREHLLHIRRPPRRRRPRSAGDRRIAQLGLAARAHRPLRRPRHPARDRPDAAAGAARACADRPRGRETRRAGCDRRHRGRAKSAPPSRPWRRRSATASCRRRTSNARRRG